MIHQEEDVWRLQRAVGPIVAVVGLFATAVVATASTNPAARPVDQRTAVALAGASIPFVANRGQWPDDVAFAAMTFAGTLAVGTDGRMHYRLHGQAARDRRGPHRTLTESLVDASNRSLPLLPAGIDASATSVSYFVGNDARRHGSAASYARVALGQPWPGIDVHLRAGGNNVEKIFTVRPGTDPSPIRVRVEGASRLAIGGDGELVAQTQNGPVSLTAPIAFQENDKGGRDPVNVRYALDGDNSYRFALGPYDAKRSLVIDPQIASTYFGGTGTDVISAIAITGTAGGAVYVTGRMVSANMVGTVNAPQPFHAADGGQTDAFVARFDPLLVNMTAFTYFGGNGTDEATGIALTGAGTVIIAGTSTSVNLPGTAGSAQPAPPSLENGFVAVYSANLQILQRATYFGGNASTSIADVAWSQPYLFVTGTTGATDLPSRNGGAQSSLASGAGNDAFVAKLPIGLDQILQTSYFGGSVTESSSSIAVHPHTGDVYITGHATSSSLPGIGGAAQAANGGGVDVFIARFAPSLTLLRQSTFFGGSGSDVVRAIAIHPLSGDVYATGSANGDLPVTAGAAQPVFGGSTTDAWVLRASADLRSIPGATYIGGAAVDSGNAIAIHPVSGEVFVAGQTTSTVFPHTAGGLYPAYGGSSDVFLARLRPDLQAVLQSTFVGTAGAESPTSLAVHPLNQEVYVTGTVSGGGFPGSGGGAFPTIQGAVDSFIARITPDLTAADRLPDPFAFAPVFGAIPFSPVVSSAMVTGFAGPAATYLVGGANARYCISTTSECGCDILAFTAATSTTIPGRYICVSNSAGAINTTTTATVHVGAGAATQTIAAGSPGGAPCSLDVDGNGNIEALTDGLMILRAMFGLTGSAVTANAVGNFASRPTWAAVQSYLNTNCGASFAP
jgi:hypothetical protein